MQIAGDPYRLEWGPYSSEDPLVQIPGLRGPWKGYVRRPSQERETIIQRTNSGFHVLTWSPAFKVDAPRLLSRARDQSGSGSRGGSRELSGIPAEGSLTVVPPPTPVSAAPEPGKAS